MNCVLEQREREIDEHIQPETLDVMIDLAEAQKNEGNLEEAGRLLTKVWEIRKKALGPYHPATQKAEILLHNLHACRSPPVIGVEIAGRDTGKPILLHKTSDTDLMHSANS